MRATALPVLWSVGRKSLKSVDCESSSDWNLWIVSALQLKSVDCDVSALVTGGL